MSLFNKIKNVFNSSSIDIPDAQTIYFKNGEMYKVYPSDKESWYDARYLVSDGVKYDLENLDDLRRIPVPKFPPHQNIMEGYGVTGNLDYVLRMKAGNFYNRKDKIMCSACLWKCTELMLAHPLSWEESHFYRESVPGTSCPLHGQLRSSAESQWNIPPASVLAAHECPGSQEVFLSAHSSASNQSFPSFSALYR